MRLRQRSLRSWVLIAACAGVLLAQAKLTVQQLVSFIESSIQLKHPDKQVAVYLSKLKLSERLDARDIEDLQGLGAGPATVAALRKLAETSTSLPTAAQKPVQAPPPQIPPPPVGVQKALLERVREYAINYSKNLPNFFCTEVIRRYRDDTGQEQWVNYDTLTARLSYFDQKEEYKLVMINNRATEESFGSVGGTISSGEFGSMLKEIFEPESEATFAWLRWATLRGKRAHVYTYKVPQSNSQWRIAYQRSHEIIVGYTGLVYVDKETRNDPQSDLERHRISALVSDSARLRRARLRLHENQRHHVPASPQGRGQAGARQAADQKHRGVSPVSQVRRRHQRHLRHSRCAARGEDQRGAPQ